MHIILANPRGFCAGVERAIAIVERALEKFGAPIYVRHEVVHNQFVCDDLRAKGAIFIDDLADVPTGCTNVLRPHLKVSHDPSVSPEPAPTLPVGMRAMPEVSTTRTPLGRRCRERSADPADQGAYGLTRPVHEAADRVRLSPSDRRPSPPPHSTPRSDPSTF